MGLVTRSTCPGVLRAVFAVYGASKIAMYLVFLARVYVTFANAAVGPRPWLVRAVAACWLAYALAMLAYVPWFEVEVVFVEQGPGFELDQCHSVIPRWSTAVFLSAELLMSAVCFLLFVRPLLAIMRQAGRESHDLLHTVVKNTLLTVLSAVTTVVSVLFVSLCAPTTHVFCIPSAGLARSGHG